MFFCSSNIAYVSLDAPFFQLFHQHLLTNFLCFNADSVSGNEVLVTDMFFFSCLGVVGRAVLLYSDLLGQFLPSPMCSLYIMQIKYVKYCDPAVSQKSNHNYLIHT